MQSQMGASNTPTCISAIRDAYKSCTKAPASSTRPLRTHTPVHLQASPPLISAPLFSEATAQSHWQGEASIQSIHSSTFTAAPSKCRTPAGGTCDVPRGQRPQRDLPQARAYSWGHCRPDRCCALSGRCAGHQTCITSLGCGTYYHPLGCAMHTALVHILPASCTYNPMLAGWGAVLSELLL